MDHSKFTFNDKHSTIYDMYNTLLARALTDTPMDAHPIMLSLLNRMTANDAVIFKKFCNLSNNSSLEISVSNSAEKVTKQLQKIRHSVSVHNNSISTDFTQNECEALIHNRQIEKSAKKHSELPVEIYKLSNLGIKFAICSLFPSVIR